MLKSLIHLLTITEKQSLPLDNYEEDQDMDVTSSPGASHAKISNGLSSQENSYVDKVWDNEEISFHDLSKDIILTFYNKTNHFLKEQQALIVKAKYAPLCKKWVPDMNIKFTPLRKITKDGKFNTEHQII